MKPQRFKAVMKGGKPTGEVRQTNAKTQGVKTKAVHGAIKAVKKQK
jgi:hypothetical protein